MQQFISIARRSVGSLVYVVTIVPLLSFFGCGPSTQKEASTQNGDEVQQLSEIEVELNSYAELRIEGPFYVDRMVYRRIGKKQLLGELVINEDGKQTEVVLFKPWGRIKVGDEYKIADLSKLRDDVRNYWDELDTRVFKEED